MQVNYISTARKGRNMISFVKGELCDIRDNRIIIEVNGIGYEAFMPLSTIDRLPSLGSVVKIHTYMYVREDAISLYGFLTPDDLYVFKLLITVNGIGPKGALGILSIMTPNELRYAVIGEDAKAIAKAPGIGSKTASKLILELKDKLRIEDAFDLTMQQSVMAMNGLTGDENDIRNEAIQALVALGYSNTESTKAVHSVEVRPGMNVEEILKLSLKNLF